MEIARQYQQYISREYEIRLRRNSGYSLRAFARDLQIQPSKLSEILHGKVGLSSQSAMKVAKHLNLDGSEAQHFVALVEREHGRSAASRANAVKRLEIQSIHFDYNLLDLRKFQVISDWYFNAILELTETSGFESNASWIAGRLGISSDLANKAILTLIELGLLKKSKSGHLKQTKAHISTMSNVPSRAIREYHRQIFEKAEAALSEVALEERDFSSITIAIPSEKIELARKKIKEFRRQLAKDLQADGSPDRVYCLAIQMFPLDRISNKTYGEKK